MAKEQRDKDREAEEARQEVVVDAVAARNAEITAGADPDPNVAAGFYPDIYHQAPLPEKGKGK